MSRNASLAVILLVCGMVVGGLAMNTLTAAPRSAPSLGADSDNAGRFKMMLVNHVIEPGTDHYFVVFDSASGQAWKVTGHQLQSAGFLIARPKVEAKEEARAEH